MHPDVTYVVARRGDDTVVVAEPLLSAVLGDEDVEVLARTTGRDWERVTYQRPFELVDFPDDNAHYVVLADYVTTEDGTGLVHQSPAFGADDLAVTRGYGMAVVNPIDATGHFLPDVPMVGGHFFKAADPALVEDLKQRGVLWKEQRYEHSYPHCWRCHTPLMYYAQPSWYIRTSAIKDKLLAENEKTNWYPENIKTGRYGDWLNNNVDWALSRDRYWGTPLPIWRNDVDPSRLVAVGSLAELSELTGRDLTDLDPHRPFIDDVTFTLPGEEGTFRRVRQVIDAWYDSGSMPFAQWGAPHRNKEEFEASYPAQFICEAIDQTRGWFYTLMAVGTLVFEKSSYENVLCLGHILAEDGRKMSKHLGNILEPIPLMDRHGADAVRWFMLAGGSPWSARRVGHETLSEVVRKVLLTYWNTASFFTLYAEANGWDPQAAPAPARAERPLLDRWALAKLAAVTEGVTDGAGGLRHPDRRPAARRVRRRPVQLVRAPLPPPLLGRRPRRAGHAARGARRPHPAHGAVHAVRHRGGVGPRGRPGAGRRGRLGAPDVLADGRRGRPGRRPGRPRWTWSAGWSSSAARRAPRRRSAPASRWPAALVAAPGWADPPPRPGRRGRRRAERRGTGRAVRASRAALVDVSVKVDFRAVGRRHGQAGAGRGDRRSPPPTRPRSPPPTAPAPRPSTSTATPVPLEDGDLIVTETPREGWTVASGSGLTVALDLTLTPELERAGLVREVVRLVAGGPQEQRAGGQRPDRAVVDRRRHRWPRRSSRARRAGAGEVLATSVHAAHGGHRCRRRGPGGLAVLGGPRRAAEARHGSWEDGVLSPGAPCGRAPARRGSGRARRPRTG